MQIEQSASLDRMGMRRAGKFGVMEGRWEKICTLLLLKFQGRVTTGASILFVMFLMLCFVNSGSGQELNPRGRNVCKSPGSSSFTCCAGWRQQGEECLIAVCEGNFTCKENEVCVRPNECRCRHGYFGANCETKCPRQFWGPDCKEKCSCHPHGQCDDVGGQCTCNPNRWGANCENACLCKHGKCDQETGKCTCEPSWWGPQCSNACYCSTNSQCDQATGRCICQPGWWARSCNNQCSCNNSPCDQMTGRCLCRERLWGSRCERVCQCFKGKCNQQDGTCTCEPGYRGKFCREPCPAGFYGQGCRRRCGQCKGLQPCTIAEGKCIACEPGWNGTKCDQTCAHGFYGDECSQTCPLCKDGHTCNHINGKCSHCNPGWIGDRCETKCRNGTYGENCAFVCTDCYNGECHFESGKCLCSAGSHGPYCNLTCATGQYGINCDLACSCHDDKCDPITGACHMEANQRMGVIGAGALVVFLLILLLSLLCCCCVCRKKEESADENQEKVTNKKAPRRFCGRFSRISMKLPRIPLRRQKLPKVVVAHHDMENTFNCSFIEPPSVVEQPSPSWSSRGSFSSFDTTDDGPVYCVPHEESVTECKEKANNSALEKITSPVNEEEAGEYTYLKDSGSPKSSQVDNSETPLLKSSDSERSSCGSGSTSGALYAKVARLSKQSKDEDDTIMDNRSATIGVKPPSPERIKPPPPDPATKPKVSWIHSKLNASQANSLPAFNKTPEKASTNSEQSDQHLGHREKEHHRKRYPSDSSPAGQGKNEEKVVMRNKDKGQKKDTNGGESKPTEEAQSPSKSKHRNKSHDHIENINGTVQNALKRIGNLHLDKKSSDAKEAPKSPDHSRSRAEVLHPHLSSEAASLFTAQLKEKTQSLNKVDGSPNQNGIGPLKSQKEKPTPPQKAKRSAAAINQKSSKAILPTSINLQKMISPVAETVPATGSPIEKQNSNSSQEQAAGVKQEAAEPAVKKTPIKKPPRKKSKDASLDTDIKVQPKTAVMPPQSVK